MEERDARTVSVDVVQQVLRGLTLALAAASRANLGDLAHLLQAAAIVESLDPQARTMLLDLAEGPSTIAAAQRH